MSKSGAMHLATRVGGSIKKEDVQSAVDRYAHRSYSGSVLFCMSYLGTSICDCTATWLADAIAVSRGMNFQRDEYFLMLYCLFRYEKYHVCFGGEEEARKANYSDMEAREFHHSWRRPPRGLWKVAGETDCCVFHSVHLNRVEQPPPLVAASVSVTAAEKRTKERMHILPAMHEEEGSRRSLYKAGAMATQQL
ncbi:hypothetical protein BHM03_00006624 [Ensete ventricosum]|nr:hypothetical protein BHM03_00006624 [Ensete ventricosum]